MNPPGFADALLVIDGARGEGGGQVARVALALGAATGRAVRVENVRAGRPEPGLKPAHVVAARALSELCGGEIEGAELGSRVVTLRPGPVVGGEHEFAVETAGSVTLILQALLPAMAASRQAFRLTLRGGTNVAWAPQWDDFARVHVPNLARVGVDVQPTLVRRGFFPVGGGEVQVEVATPALHRVAFESPGEVRRVGAVVASHGLPRHVVERALVTVEEGLREEGPLVVEQDFHRGPGVGFAVAVRAECAASTLGGDAVGKKGTRVEDVVGSAVADLRAELRAGAGLDLHQADQMPVFLALAGGGSFTCRHLSPHAKTVLGLIPEFLPVEVATGTLGALARVEIRRA